jgi:hypothetical protein
MFDPRLKIARGGFDDGGGCKTRALHRSYRIVGQIIDETEVVVSPRSDIDISSIAILVSKPCDRSYERIRIPNTRKHDCFLGARVGPEEADLEYIPSHGVHLPLNSLNRSIGSRR